MRRIAVWCNTLMLTMALASCGESPTAPTTALEELTTLQIELDQSVDPGLRARVVTVASAVDARPFRSPQTALAVPSARGEPVLVVALDARGEPVLEALSISGQAVVLSYESTAHSLAYSFARLRADEEALFAKTMGQLAASVQASAARRVSYYDDEAVRTGLIELTRVRPVIARTDVVGFSQLSVNPAGSGAVSITNTSLIAFSAGALGQSVLVPARGSVDITGLTAPSHALTLDLQGPALTPNGLNLAAIAADFVISAIGVTGAGSSELHACFLGVFAPSMTQLLADASNDETLDIPTAIGGLLLRSRGAIAICFKDYIEAHVERALWGTLLKRVALVTAIWDAGRFAIENGPFLFDFADAVADSPFAMLLCRRSDGSYDATPGSICPGLFTGSWSGSYSFGRMSAVLQQAGTSVQGQVTDAAGCVWGVTGTASGDNLALPSWVLLVPTVQVCVGASVTLQGSLDAAGTRISGQGQTTLAGGGVFPWTFAWSRQ